MKSTLLNIHCFVREKNIELIFPQSKNEKISDTKIKKELHKKESTKKDDTKTRHPQVIFYEKRS